MMAEDFSIFFDETGVADRCVVDGRDVVGIFTLDGSLSSNVEGEIPTLLLVASEVPAIAHGSTVVAPKYEGRTYKVRQILPESAGKLYRLVLEEV